MSYEPPHYPHEQRLPPVFPPGYHGTPDADGYYPPPQRDASPPQPPRRRKRRIFLWVFLAIQALFVIWVITGVAGGGSIHSEAVAYCHAHPSQFLSFSECVSGYGGGAKVGTAIGAGLIVVLWAVADVILGVSYGVWRLARR